MKPTRLWPALLAACAALPAAANDGRYEGVYLEEVTIIGTRENVQRVTGSAHYIDALALERFADAEREFLSALSIISESLGNDHFRADAVRGRVVALYESLGLPEEAERYRSQ